MTSTRELLTAWDTWRHLLDGDRPPRFSEDNAWERLSALFETVREEGSSERNTPAEQLLHELVEAFDDLVCNSGEPTVAKRDRYYTARDAVRNWHYASKYQQPASSRSLGRLE